MKHLIPALFISLIAACGSIDEGPFLTGPAAPGKLAVRTLVTGLDTPWDITMGPDGVIWVTERRGVVSRIDTASGQVSPVGTIEAVEQSESGLLGLALHPDFAGQGGAALRFAPFRGRRVGFIQTRLPGTKESVLDSTTGTLLERLTILGGELVSEIRCAHSSAEISEAVGRLRGLECDMILIAGASAIVDRRDIVPSGIVAAGGEIDHFGMPVDPGNLLLMAHLGEIDVLGLPGCARSLKLNGFDWVLRRRFADIPVTRHDIMTMGAGGLLMEISSRPLPRAFASPKDPTAPPADAQPGSATKIAAIVLAAGQSRRMGDINKLLVEVDGVAMVTCAVDAALASGAEPVIVVTGHESGKMEKLLAGRAVKFIHNADFAEGMSTSVRAGLNALDADTGAALICLGDMPHVDSSLISRLIAGFDPARGISPDDCYVRVAAGLDDSDTAPVSGSRAGSGDETLDVEVRVGAAQG